MDLETWINKIAAFDQDSFIDQVSKKNFDDLIAGYSALFACDQGRFKHLEGDVAQHSFLVFSQLQKLCNSPEFISGFDQIDLLAAIVHDLEKPSCRVVDAVSGDVSFPGHESKAAMRCSEIAESFKLSKEQQDKLTYLVANHGVAHYIDKMTEIEVREIFNSNYWFNLALLQEADALSCWLDPAGETHLPVHKKYFKNYYLSFTA